MTRSIYRSLLPALAAGLFLSSAAALAVEIPGTFVTEEVPLKSMAVAGTTVTATLYSDSSCTAVVATTGAVNIESVDLRERIKPLFVKSALTKPPKVVRLHFNFSAAPTTGDLYVDVTSSVVGAIVGYPAGCQLQTPYTAQYSATSCITLPPMPLIFWGGFGTPGWLCCPSGMVAVDAGLDSGVLPFGCGLAVSATLPDRFSGAYGGVPVCFPADGRMFLPVNMGGCNPASLTGWIQCCP